eukprot:5627329-Amphidinium_carterae.1
MHAENMSSSYPNSILLTQVTPCAISFDANESTLTQLSKRLHVMRQGCPDPESTRLTERAQQVNQCSVECKHIALQSAHPHTSDEQDASHWDTPETPES